MVRSTPPDPARPPAAAPETDRLRPETVAVPAAPPGPAARVDTPAPAGPTPGPASGPIIGPYLIGRLLGQGGVGRVYQAWDDRLQRHVALKVMRPGLAADPAARAGFVRAARAAAGVVHDHVVTVYEVGQAGDVPYLAMQLLRGMTADKFLAANGRPPADHALRIAREAAAGLAAAHARGLAHGGLSPACLWLEAPGGRVKVLDFGLAAPAARPEYQSPEQAGGAEPDARADLFALGAVLAHLCTGRPPAAGGPALSPRARLKVPKPLVDLIDRLTAADPAARPGLAAAADGLARAEAALAARRP